MACCAAMEISWRHHYLEIELRPGFERTESTSQERRNELETMFAVFVELVQKHEYFLTHCMALLLKHRARYLDCWYWRFRYLLSSL
jgi:hypothetical protein